MRSRPEYKQRGMALIAVLWMIAALAILVASAVYAVRIDTRMAFAHLDAARARALSEAAITQAAAEFAALPAWPLAPFDFTSQLDGHTIVVTVSRDSGYISLNNAPETLLVDLFQYGAQLPPLQAQQLAARVLRWRTPSATGADPQLPAPTASALRPAFGFGDPAELQKIAGVDARVYATLRPLLTVQSGGGNGLVNALNAPEGVLRVLTQGNSDQLRRLLAIRASGDSAEQTSIRFNQFGIRHHLAWFSTIFHFQVWIKPQAAGDGGWQREAVLALLPAHHRSPGQRPWHWQTLYPVIKKPA